MSIHSFIHSFLGRGDCDFNNKLKLLTETQFPYGPDCRLDRMLQCVFGHYSVSDEAVKLIEEAGFVSISDCRFANPDTAEGRGRATT